MALSCAILSRMPRPKSEHEALEHELREELPAQLAAYQQKLSAGPADKTQRERLSGRSGGCTSGRPSLRRG